LSLTPLEHAPAVARLLAVALALACAGATPPAGTLALSIVDGSTGVAASARVELVDAQGDAIVPAGAMPIRRGECFDTAIPDWLLPPRAAEGIFNPYTGNRNFYVDDRTELVLPSGSYRIRVFKGIEFEVAEATVVVRPDRMQELRIELRRWIDLSARGWVGGDDHLHISRAGPEDDAPLARWMAAEGLRVANLLQGGNATSFDITPQYAFGAEGTYDGDEALLVPGQEHPRTHILGHTIILGVSSPIDLRDAYLLHERFFTEAERQGALSGYAHWGSGAGGVGAAIDAPTGLLRFVEVLDFDYAGYQTWYDLLDLGFRITPTAGTDFPCNPFTIPGRDRFYTQVDGDPSASAWLAGVRAGRTFVTNGPIVALEVNGVGIGQELRIPAPGTVEVVGSVRFDATRDDVHALELVRAGEVIASAAAGPAPGEIELRQPIRVEESTWLALRARGAKRGETTPPQPSASTRLVARWLPKVQGGVAFAERFMREESHWPSAAHTAAIYVEVVDTPALSEQPAAAAVAVRWLARIEALRERLAPERIEDVPIWSVPTGDGAPLEVLERDREGLIEAIDRAAAFYEAVAGSSR